MVSPWLIIVTTEPLRPWGGEGERTEDYESM